MRWPGCDYARRRGDGVSWLCHFSKRDSLVRACHFTLAGTAALAQCAIVNNSQSFRATGLAVGKAGDQGGDGSEPGEGPRHREPAGAGVRFVRRRIQDNANKRSRRWREAFHGGGVWTGRVAGTMHDQRVRAPAGTVADGGAGAQRVRRASPCGGGSGNRNGKDAGVFVAGDLQRAAGGDFDSNEVAAGTAVPERHSVFAETLRAGVEGRGDEGAIEFFVPRETAPDGGPAGAQRHGGNG